MDAVKLWTVKSWIFSILIFAGGINVSEMAFIFKAGTSEDLQDAIKNAQAGDKIELLPVAYYGNFVLGKFSGGNDPVMIYGTTNEQTGKTTTIFPSKGKEDSTAFQVTGDNWVVQNLVINGFATVANVEGNGNSLLALLVTNFGNGFKINGNKSRVQSCVFQNGYGTAINLKGNKCSIISAVIKKTNDGVIVSGQNPELLSNVITAKRTLTVLQGVRFGDMKSNVLRGPATFSGSDFDISSNVANGGITIDGSGNHFRSNVFNQVYFNNNYFYDDGGNVFNYASGSIRKNIF